MLLKYVSLYNATYHACSVIVALACQSMHLALSRLVVTSLAGYMCCFACIAQPVQTELLT